MAVPVRKSSSRQLLKRKVAKKARSAADGFKTVKFQADSALLRELGERLVGQPHIALAELIKNSYDADAFTCEVDLDGDKITVSDNGHGMDEGEFMRFWMRIGTRNKERNPTSRELGRPTTGSKGVGRLAAQFLAHRMELITVPKGATSRQLRAKVDWDKAIDAGDLTEATASYRVEPRTCTFPDGKLHGTQVIMRGLKQGWENPDALKALARELWVLQPPQPDRYMRTRGPRIDPNAFKIQFSAQLANQAEAFDEQMRAALGNWMAMIQGNVRRGPTGAVAHVVVTFRDGEQFSETFNVDPLIARANWSIWVYSLQGRQAHGVKVDDAREYFEKFGGVQLYDAGFRLPYYGVQQDWLSIEYDHSHRRSRSALLPERLQVTRALNDLPSQGRLYGVVQVNTGQEAKLATPSQMRSGDYLKIQVSRDRLVANGAYVALRDAVRWSIDYYATRQRLRTDVPSTGSVENPLSKVDRVRHILADLKAEHPKDELVQELAHELDALEAAFEADQEAEQAARSLLGPLASAGMAALALEHENRKEIRTGRALVRRLNSLAKEIDDPRLSAAAENLSGWIDRMEATRRLFSPLLEEEDREKVEAFDARSVLEQVVENVRILTPGVTIDVAAGRGQVLPPATFAEWNSLFQNVIINAANATLDSKVRRVRCSSGVTGRGTWVRISDTGVGVDLASADSLFEPFQRKTRISEERRGLGLGGMGLGLTIVRMIANQRRCRVSFVEPEDGFATTFMLSWSRQADDA